MTEQSQLRRVRADIDPVDEFELRREHVLQLLGVHYANEDLTTPELDARMGAAFRAASHLQLDELLLGLPPLPPSFDSRAEAITARIVDVNEVPPRGFVGAIFGAAERKGRWLVPRYLKVWAMVGGVELDLRQARFAPGITNIEVTVVMGGVEIVLPPDVSVESSGMAFAGGYVTQTGDSDSLDPNRPIVRLSGFTLMGGVEAKLKTVKPKALARFRKRLARMREE